MRKRYTLSDAQWECIKNLLPGQAGQPGATAKDNRLFVDAVLYRYREGIPWRDLPSRFGDFRVVHTHQTPPKVGVFPTQLSFWAWLYQMWNSLTRRCVIEGYIATELMLH